MKLSILVLNVIAVLLILVTPRVFYDDYSIVMDLVIFIFIAINSIYVFKVSKYFVLFSVSSILAIFHIVTSVAIEEELGINMSRIEFLGIDKFIIINIENSLLNNISFAVFIVFSILEVGVLITAIVEVYTNTKQMGR